MKKIILLLMMMLPMAASAQRIDKPGEPYDVYCKVRLDSKTFIYIGENDKLFYFVDEKGKAVRFYPENEILTYMEKRGWKLAKYISEHEFIFKKTVTKDEEAYEHLPLNENPLKK